MKLSKEETVQLLRDGFVYITREMSDPVKGTNDKYTYVITHKKGDTSIACCGAPSPVFIDHIDLEFVDFDEYQKLSKTVK